MDEIICAAKAALRRALKERLVQVTPQQRAAWSQALCGHLRDFLQKRTLVAFIPLPDEPDILPVVKECWAAGQPVILPRLAGNNLELHEVRREEELVPGPWGLRQPDAQAPRWKGGAAVCWVPGVAFDQRGARLGRGRGFYDRLLGTDAMSDVVTVGVFFACQQVHEVPVAAHDRRLHHIVTEAGILQSGNARRSVLDVRGRD